MVTNQATITLEPPAPRRLANDLPADRNPLEAQKDILWDFTDDGTRVWKEREDDATKLTVNLRRLWEERGDYSQLTIKALEKTAQRKKDGLDTQASTILEKDGENEKSKGVGQTNKASTDSITAEELWEMRMKMAQQLGIIGGELSTGLDLLNILLGPLAPEAVDTASLPMPAGGLAPMIHSSDLIPPQPEPIILIDSSVSLMRKQKATQNAAGVLKRAAIEMGLEAKRSQQQWGTLLDLREAGWNMRPKGAKPGADVGLMGRGAERAAKEIGIAFATTEAAEALRASSFASLEPLSLEGQDPTEFALKLPPRPRRRLTISLALPDGRIEHFSPWSQHDVRSLSAITFAEDLDLARAEVLEEEIFGEISKEAQLTAVYRTTTSDCAVIVQDLGQRTEVRFEMLEKTVKTNFPNGCSPYGKLISSMLRILMISVYRFRRRCATGVLSSGARHPQPKILEPILDLIVFYTYTSNLRKLLLRALSGLEPAKLEAEVEYDSILESAQEITKLLCEASDADSPRLEIGGMATLRLTGRRSVTLTIACPAVIALWLENKPMKIEPEQMYEVLVHEIGECINGILCEFLDKQRIATRPVPAGLVCRYGHSKLFLAPSFKFGTGLTVKVERVGGPSTEQSDDKLLPDDYSGQMGLKDWVEKVGTFLSD